MYKTVQRGYQIQQFELVSKKKVHIFLYLYITVVLWSGCFSGWVRHLTRSQVDPRQWTECKLFYFMFYLGNHLSSTLLVIMSVEKCFAVYFPLKSKTVCTVRTAKWATGIVGVVLAVYNTNNLFLEYHWYSDPYYC